MKKLNVCFIAGKTLPVPNVKGGAIETLLTNLAKENETHQKVNITVVSVFDKHAAAQAQKYPHTNFIFIKDNFALKLINLYYKVTNIVFRRKKLAYNEVALKKIKHQAFDYIIVEGGAEDYFLTYLKHFKKEQMVYHLHYNGRTTPLMERTFSKLIGVSHFVTNEFKKTSDIPRFDVLDNGIDANVFDKKISEKDILSIRKKHGLKGDDFVVLYVGRLIKEKGVLELIKAVDDISDQSVKLLIVGSANFADTKSSPYTQEITNIISGSARVKVTGYVKNHLLYKYYQSANLQVVPSLWEDASPLAPVEGMLSRLPVVGTDSGGLQEILKGRGIIIKRDQDFIKNLQEAILATKNQQTKVDLEKNYIFAKARNIEKMYFSMIKLLHDYQKWDNCQ